MRARSCVFLLGLLAATACPGDSQTNDAGGTGSTQGTGTTAAATTSTTSAGSTGTGATATGSSASTGGTTSGSGGTTAGSTSTASTTGASSVLPVGAAVLFESSCPSGFAELVGVQNSFLAGHDGDETYDEAGGAATHSHDVGAHTHTLTAAGGAHTHSVTLGNPSQTVAIQAGGVETSVAAGTHAHAGTTSDSDGSQHTHALPDDTPDPSGDGANEPPWREVVLCEVTDPALAELPAATLLLRDSACGNGLTPATEFQGRFIRGHDGDRTFGEEGGALQHGHDVPHDHSGQTSSDDAHAHGSLTETNALSESAFDNVSDAAAAAHDHDLTLSASAHPHTLTAGSPMLSSQDVEPEYREVNVCRADAAVDEFPAGGLVLFNAVCPDGFTEALAYRNRFLRGEAGDETIDDGGSPDHTHTAAHAHGIGTETNSAAHLHGASTGGPNQVEGAGPDGGSSTLAASLDHTHSGTSSVAGGHTHVIEDAAPTVSDADHTPPFREFVVCRKD